MLRIALMICSLAFLSTTAMAKESTMFWGISYGQSTYEEPGYSADMGTLTARLGWDYEAIPSHLLVGAEVRLGYGFTGSYNDVDIKMNYFTSGLLRAGWQFMDRLFLTLYGGYSAADTEATTRFGSSKVTDESVSYGISLDLYANSRQALTIEGMRYLDSTMRGADYTIDYVGISFINRF